MIDRGLAVRPLCVAAVDQAATVLYMYLVQDAVELLSAKLLRLLRERRHCRLMTFSAHPGDLSPEFHGDEWQAIRVGEDMFGLLKLYQCRG